MGFTDRIHHIPMALSLDIVYAFPYSGIYGIHFLSILYLSIYCISILKKMNVEAESLIENHSQ